MAREAAAIVAQIRFEEMQTVWTSELEDDVAKRGDVFPGMMFNKAKKRAEGTRLWKIVRKMPKGALLHCHLEAMVDLGWLVNTALNIDGICIHAPQHLFHPEARHLEDFFFTYKRKASTLSHNEPSIWSDSYEAGTPVPIAHAADTFPDGGRAGFVEFVTSRCSVTDEESLEHHLGPHTVWRKFRSAFPILGSLIYYEPVLRRFVRKMCQELSDDGVQWVDLRAAFVFKYRKEGAEEPMEPEEGYAEMLRVLGEEVEAFKASEEGTRFWGARMIWTTIRSFGKKQIVESEPHPAL